MTEQLDLLSWVPPRQTIVFPFAKRVGKVREVADKLRGKTQGQGGAYWSQMIDGQVRTLERIGFSDAEIDAEINAFRAAVQRELDRRAYAGQLSRPGGDAA